MVKQLKKRRGTCLPDPHVLTTPKDALKTSTTCAPVQGAQGLAAAFATARAQLPCVTTARPPETPHQPVHDIVKLHLLTCKERGMLECHNKYERRSCVVSSCAYPSAGNRRNATVTLPLDGDLDPMRGYRTASYVQLGFGSCAVSGCLSVPSGKRRCNEVALPVAAPLTLDMDY